MKYTIPVVTRTQDNGDGGYTTYIYNNEDELIKDHPLSKSYQIIDGKYKETYAELSQSEIDDILNEDNPYENGYIGSDTIEIEIIDGVAKLIGNTSFHAGQ